MKKVFVGAAVIALWLNHSSVFAETSSKAKRAVPKKPVVQEETVAQFFEKNIADLKTQCQAGKHTAAICNIPYMQPYNSLATPEGRYAESIPLPVEPPVNLYKPGMTSDEYFNTLCKYEAGELIVKPAENVIGILQIRPREPVTEEVLQHLYAMEDPYGYQTWEATRPQDVFVQPPMGRYKFLEIQGRQYFRDKELKSNKSSTVVMEGKSVKVPYMVSDKPISKLESKYGYIWRAIRRTKDRELGIAGSELIILDLDANKVIAVRRGFVRGVAQNSPSGIWWPGGQRCPYVQNPETYTVDFIYRVLQPTKEQTP